MKKLSTLRDKVKIEEQRINSRVGISIMLLLLALAFLIPYEEKANELANELFFDGALSFLIILGMAGLIIPLVFMPKRIRKKFGYTCPQCKKAFDATLYQVAIASKHCGNCGAPVRCEPVERGNSE